MVRWCCRAGLLLVSIGRRGSKGPAMLLYGSRLGVVPRRAYGLVPPGSLARSCPPALARRSFAFCITSFLHFSSSTHHLIDVEVLHSPKQQRETVDPLLHDLHEPVVPRPAKRRIGDRGSAGQSQRPSCSRDGAGRCAARCESGLDQVRNGSGGGSSGAGRSLRRACP